jgi:hypothetical protein
MLLQKKIFENMPKGGTVIVSLVWKVIEIFLMYAFSTEKAAETGLTLITPFKNQF